MSVWHICISSHALWAMHCTGYFSAVYVEHLFNMVERFLEVFMDDFSVFGSTFDEGLYRLSLVLISHKEKNLVLN